MHWVISDIHGCYSEYLELLEKLRLTDRDVLFVLGDAIDRGPDSMDALLDVLSRPGTVYLPGNHDFFLRRLGPAYGFTSAEGRTAPSLFERALHAGWMLDGGRATLEQFRALPASKRRDVLDRLEEAPAFAEVTADSRRFVLVHKAVPGFPGRPRFADWSLAHFLRRSGPYTRPFFADSRTVVSGHTWTAQIRPDGSSLVFTSDGHVAIDCGCVFGGALAAYCLESGETVYVPSRRQPQH